MTLHPFPVIITIIFEFFLCGSVYKLLMLLIPYSGFYIFLNMLKIYVHFIIFTAVYLSDTHAEYQIWSFYCNLFLSFAVNPHACTHTRSLHGPDFSDRARPK